MIPIPVPRVYYRSPRLCKESLSSCSSLQVSSSSPFAVVRSTGHTFVKTICRTLCSSVIAFPSCSGKIDNLTPIEKTHLAQKIILNIIGLATTKKCEPVS